MPFALFFLETGLAPYLIWFFAFMFVPFKLFYPFAIAGAIEMGYTFILIYMAIDLITYICLGMAIIQEIIIVPLFIISPITLTIGILLYI